MNYENELLTITMEECAEVVQACSKLIRFGPDSEYNGQNALESLEKELGDLWCMIELMHENDMISWTRMDEYASEKRKKLQKWSNLFEGTLDIL
jgi:NTP pyrophosphatase (non-canonical NTP hydrolase)